jgi:hypothetical protein
LILARMSAPDCGVYGGLSVIGSALCCRLGGV